MKHQVFGRKFNRDVKERKAMFKSLVISLIKYGRIRISLAKAKAISRLVDKLVTHAKFGSESGKKKILSFLANNDAVEHLVKKIIPRFSQKVGGYLRIRRIGIRRGDSSEEVQLEWSVDEAKSGKNERRVEKKDNKSDKKY